MRYSAAFVALAVCVVSPVSAHSQGVGEAHFVPKLGDIMEVTQLRHLKLWYAGRLGNWPLAGYELERIKNAFRDAMTFYPGLPSADMATMEKPANQIGAAIRSKDSEKFVKTFSELTAACNSCHKSQGYGFIVIRVPTSSPFANELFRPE
jgi:hypothetical protein